MRTAVLASICGTVAIAWIAVLGHDYRAVYNFQTGATDGYGTLYLKIIDLPTIDMLYFLLIPLIVIPIVNYTYNRRKQYQLGYSR